MARGVVLLALVALAACGSSNGQPFEVGGDPYASHFAIEGRLGKTVRDLAALGNRRAGSQAASHAADYVAQRFKDAGLDVALEPFAFPGFSSSASSLVLTAAGASLASSHDVPAYSGAGMADADVVHVGAGRDADYAGKDVTAKVALIDVDPTQRRASQYRVAVARGAAAVLFASASPVNEPALDAASDAEDGLGAIPALALGADDAAALAKSLAGGKGAHATLSVTAAFAPAKGQNVVARLAGADATKPSLVVTAHHDAWFAGAAVDGGGVAAMLEIAEAFAHGKSRELGVAFVSLDGGEVGGLGAVAFVRKHLVVGKEPLLAFASLALPAASPGAHCSLAHTDGGPLDAALRGSKASTLYAAYVVMHELALVPSDAATPYRTGLQGFVAACDAPYGGTSLDTPSSLDADFLASAVLDVEDALGQLDGDAPPVFAVRDTSLLALDATAAPAGADLGVTVTVKDGSGVAKPAVTVRAWLDVDDFTRAFDVSVPAGADGTAKLTIPAAALAKGKGSRWLHLTAGEPPLAEEILKLP